MEQTKTNTTIVDASLLKFSCIQCGAPTKYNNGKCNSCYTKDQPKTVVKSEGEEFIADFLDLYKIEFEEQKAIVGLMKDSKKYRIADFYLPEYKLYIEYNGRYLDNREHYDEKIKVYKLNKIPCVHLYPENLGVLDFILDKRIVQELKDKKMNDELKQYKWFKMKKSSIGRIVLISFLIAIMTYFLIDFHKGDRGVLVLVSSIIVFQIYKLFITYKMIFKEEKFPLNLIE